MGNDLLNELIRDISGDPLQLKRLETFIREKGFRSYSEALNELLNVYYGCEGRLKYSRILNEHIDKLSQISDKLAAISKTLGQFADVYVNLARVDWGLIEDFLAKQRMSRVMPYVLELRRWIFTNGQLLNALMLATEIYNTAIKYIDFVQNEMQKLIMIAKMAGCPICMKLSNYIAEYNKEYSVIINATNIYLTTINEWNNKCASQIHAEFCNKYFTVAKNVATVLKKHIDRSINDCY